MYFCPAPIFLWFWHLACGVSVKNPCHAAKFQSMLSVLGRQCRLPNALQRSLIHTAPVLSASWWPKQTGSRRWLARSGPATKPRRRPAPTIPTPIFDTEGGASVDELEMNQILGRTLNRTTSSSIKCTFINQSGEVQISHGDFKRADLISRFGLLPRDLRKLDVSVRNIVPAILVRDSSIVVNLLHIRAIIKRDCMLIVDLAPTDPETSRGQSLFMYDLQHKLRQPLSVSNLPYELRALETILVSVVNTLSLEFKTHDQIVRAMLHELEQGLDRQQLQRLLVQSKELAAFGQKAKLIRDELEELLDNDRDLSRLYLSRAEENPDDSDVEAMLESYYSQLDEIVQNAEHLSGNIKSTEEYINILLDSNRNSLMLLEVRFQVCMLGLGCGSAVAALYGMNLKNMIEDTNWGFAAVCSAVIAISLATVWSGMRRLARIEKIKERFRK